MFIKNDQTSITLAVVYVDDIIVTGNNITEITTLKTHLHATFSIKDLGNLGFFLGIEVTHLPNGIALTRNKFTQELLHSCDITSFKHVVTLLPLNTKLYTDPSPPFSNLSLYRSIVVKLNFLPNTRPDLAYTTQTLSQFMQSPTESHYHALLHTLHYLHSTIVQGILLNAADKLTLQAYSDSDWGAYLDSQTFYHRLPYSSRLNSNLLEV